MRKIKVDWPTVGMFGMGIVGVIVMGLAIMLGGCASYAPAPAPIPDGLLPEKATVTYELEPQEGDAELVEVTVGEMRLALATKERYEGMVERQNIAVDSATEAVYAQREAALVASENERTGVVNSVIVGITTGFVGTVLVVLSIMLGGI